MLERVRSASRADGEERRPCCPADRWQPVRFPIWTAHGRVGTDAERPAIGWHPRAPFVV